MKSDLFTQVLDDIDEYMVNKAVSGGLDTVEAQFDILKLLLVKRLFIVYLSLNKEMKREKLLKELVDDIAESLKDYIDNFKLIEADLKAGGEGG
jgi:hypothetical protein